jgi:hypothetical protein
MVPSLAKNNGYVLLISTLIVAAVSLSIVLTLLFVGTINMENAFDKLRIAQAQASVYTCAEEALSQIIGSTSYSGAGSLNIDSGATCQYEVVNLGGNNRQVRATGTAPALSVTFYRKLLINISAVRPKIVISSWQEIE